jgi:hypothetical protein
MRPFLPLIPVIRFLHLDMLFIHCSHKGTGFHINSCVWVWEAGNFRLVKLVEIGLVISVSRTVLRMLFQMLSQ